jgi:hypothetical protein
MLRVGDSELLGVKLAVSVKDVVSVNVEVLLCEELPVLDAVSVDVSVLVGVSVDVAERL